MKIIYSLFAIILMLILQSCPKGNEPDMYFKIKNDSSYEIVFDANTLDTIMNISDIYEGHLRQLKTNSNFQTEYWRRNFDNNRKLNIIIFKKSIFDAYSWEEIQEKNLYDKRYVLSLEELKAMNYTVVYDGK